MTTTPSQVQSGKEPTRRRRGGIWMSVAGVLFTLLGGVAVLVTRDGPDRPSDARVENNTPAADQPQAPTATTVAGDPASATNRPPGAVGPRSQPGAAASPSGPSPATPEQVAELLAGLPLQLEQAATAGGQPRELPPEEVEKIVEGLLREIGANP